MESWRNTWRNIGVESVPPNWTRRFDRLVEQLFRIFAVVDARRTGARIAIAAISPNAAAGVSGIVGIAQWIEAVEQRGTFAAHAGFIGVVFEGPPAAIPQRVAAVLELLRRGAYRIAICDAVQ